MCIFEENYTIKNKYKRIMEYLYSFENFKITQQKNIFEDAIYFVLISPLKFLFTQFIFIYNYYLQIRIYYEDPIEELINVFEDLTVFIALFEEFIIDNFVCYYKNGYLAIFNDSYYNFILYEMKELTVYEKNKEKSDI
jgi:hypothetical protein